MENPLIITVTQGNNINKHCIYLPSEKPIQDPHDLKVKFYNRGKYAYRSRWNGQFINALLNEETKENIKNIILYCYMFGLSIEEIKTEFKKAYGRV